MNSHGIVIIGSGMAGYSLAREFRRLDRAAPLTIVTADDGAVYSKPMLSNALAQNKTPEALVQKDSATAAAEMDIVVRPHTRVTAIDRAARKIVVDTDGTANVISYDDLVFATGATPRTYRVEGSDRIPVATVNGLDDYRRWRRDLEEGDHVLLIGAGLIGVEFANDLVTAGHRVTLVDPAPQPLGRLLPGEIGSLLADALAEVGVEVICGTSVAALESDGDTPVARLEDGRRIAFDHALSAIGLVANTGLAVEAGLAVDLGIVVDTHLRTDDPHVYAIGDCAQTGAGMLPFILPLMAEARALARTLTGEPTPLNLPALPVVVKTPALPVAICPPRPGAEGRWEVDGTDRDRRALFVGIDGTPLGFALTGTHTGERLALAKEMPDLLAA